MKKVSIPLPAPWLFKLALCDVTKTGGEGAATSMVFLPGLASPASHMLAPPSGTALFLSLFQRGGCKHRAKRVDFCRCFSLYS